MPRSACGVLAVVTGNRDRQRKAAGVVGGREQVAAGAPDKAHYCVECDTVTRVIRAEAFARPLFETLAAQRFDLAFRRQARRVWLSFSESWPYAGIFTSVLENLHAEPVWSPPG